MQPQAVRQRRTDYGYDDTNKELSDRHRLWGTNCPATDIDFLMLEYDGGKAMALVEYKRETADEENTHPNTLASIGDLGSRAGIPAFKATYSGDFSLWSIEPLNRKAEQWVPTKTVMKELSWICLLYRIRGRKMPDDVRAYLYSLVS